MENKKFIKNITLGLICLSVLVLIGLSVYQHTLLKNLSSTEISETIVNEDTAGDAPSEAGVIAQQSTSKNTSSPPAQVKQPDISDIDELEDKLMATEQELDEAYQQISDEAARKEELKKKQLELQKQFASSPAARSSFRSYLDTQYADIFKELNLSAEELEKFKDLLTDQQMASSEIYMEAQNAPSEEEKTELQKRLDEFKEKTETELREFLGNVDYEKYHRYTDSSNERYVVTGFSETLSTDNKLTDDQKQNLIDLMYKERKDVFSETSFDSSSIATITSEMNEEGIEQRMKRTEEIDAGAIRKAGSILNDSQLEEFKKYLENRRERMSLSLRLSYSD